MMNRFSRTLSKHINGFFFAFNLLVRHSVLSSP
jgi:hypothetical protein